MSRALLPLLLLAMFFGANSASAQERLGGWGRGRMVESQVGQPLRRQQLEQQVRRGLWHAAKNRVGLTDEQMTRLEQTSQRFDGQRRALVQEERAQRLTLRSEILAGEKADQNRVASALDRLLQLQRQRLELQAEEQREFAAFMTPIQRAKYAALQEAVRRRVEALRRQRPDSAPGIDAP